MTPLPLLFAIDVDRTLLDTDKVATRLYDIVEAQGVVSAAQLQMAQSEIQSSGGSFDAIGYLQSLGVDDAELAIIYKKFVGHGRFDELLYPDTERLLQAIADRSVLITYGGVAWQQAKIEAAGLGQWPRIITAMKHKGAMIASWRNGDNYVVKTDNAGTFTAPSITLVDDKADSFLDLPADCHGFWIVRQKNLLPSQAGIVPAHVRQIQNLAEIKTA